MNMLQRILPDHSMFQILMMACLHILLHWHLANNKGVGFDVLAGSERGGIMASDSGLVLNYTSTIFRLFFSCFSSFLNMEAKNICETEKSIDSTQKSNPLLALLVVDWSSKLANARFISIKTKNKTKLYLCGEHGFFPTDSLRITIKSNMTPGSRQRKTAQEGQVLFLSILFRL